MSSWTTQFNHQRKSLGIAACLDINVTEKVHIGSAQLSQPCSFVANPFFTPFQVMALPIPIVVDNFADYYSEQVSNAERIICKCLPTADDQISITNANKLALFQKKLEAKELKREAQTIEDKWEMRKAILAKEALIESVCSTTKVSRRQTIEGKAICNHQVSHSS